MYPHILFCILALFCILTLLIVSSHSILYPRIILYPHITQCMLTFYFVPSNYFVSPHYALYPHILFCILALFCILTFYLYRRIILYPHITPNILAFCHIPSIIIAMITFSLYTVSFLASSCGCLQFPVKVGSRRTFVTQLKLNFLPIVRFQNSKHFNSAVFTVKGTSLYAIYFLSFPIISLFF